MCLFRSIVLMVIIKKMLMWLVLSNLYQITIGAVSLFDMVLNNVKCSCERSVELDVSQTKIHVYNFQSGSLGSWYFVQNAAKNITLRKDFDQNQCVVVYVTGYTNTMDGSPAEMVRCALSQVTCRDRRKPLLLIVDHSIYTTQSNIMDQLRLVGFYQKAVSYSKSIGYSLGHFLVNLLTKVDRKNLFVVGHSMGAHIAGYAAEYVRKTTSSRLKTLYGIDPAAPCYEDCPSEHVRSGLADAVMSFHCDAGEQGSALNVADYDFYAGDGESQTLCSPAGWDLFYARASSSCSHNVCVSIVLSPSVVESGWTGVKCDSYESYASGACSSNEVTSEVGLMRVPTSSPGVYYFTSPTDLICYIK